MWTWGALCVCLEGAECIELGELAEGYLCGAVCFHLSMSLMGVKKVAQLQLAPSAWHCSLQFLRTGKRTAIRRSILYLGRKV